jgi:hypothetical protein
MVPIQTRVETVADGVAEAIVVLITGSRWEKADRLIADTDLHEG